MKINLKYILILFVIFVAGIAVRKYVQTKNNTSQRRQQNSNTTKEEQQSSTTYQPKKNQESLSAIPQKAYDTWNYIKSHHTAQKGYIGGRDFQNREKKLPAKNKEGVRIHYKEWDINPSVKGQNRGAERLVSEDFERAWYTSDHYQTFSALNE